MAPTFVVKQELRNEIIDRKEDSRTRKEEEKSDERNHENALKIEEA